MTPFNRDSAVLMAQILNKLGVVVPSPGAGLQVAQHLATIQRVIDEPVAATLAVRPLLIQSHAEAKQFAAGWAFHQKLMIDARGDALNNEKEPA